MVNDGGDVQLEKRSYYILSLATERTVRVFSDKGKGKRSSREASTVEVEEDSLIRETKSFSLRKRKLDEHETQSPNRVASSSSSFPVASKRRLVVPNEPVREIEPVREREAPVRREEAVRERRETPEWLVNLLREENGFDAKLIFEKKLTATDIAKHQNRLLIPLNMIVDHDFLNEKDMKTIMEHHLKRGDKGVDVIFVGFKGQKCELNFRRWDMKSSANYVLVSGWHNAAANNGLRVDQTIHLWSFHSPENLYFALAPPDPAPAMALAPPADPVPAPEALASVPASVPASALAPVPAQALAPVVSKNFELLCTCEACVQAEVERNRKFVNFPKRKRGSQVRVPTPDPGTRESDHDGQSRSDLCILAAMCCEESLLSNPTAVPCK